MREVAGAFLNTVFNNGIRTSSTTAVRGNDVLDDACELFDAGDFGAVGDAVGIYLAPFFGAGPHPTSKILNVKIDIR